MMCQRMGKPPISTMGLGRCDVSSLSRLPSPPAKITAFIDHPCPVQNGPVQNFESIQYMVWKEWKPPVRLWRHRRAPTQPARAALPTQSCPRQKVLISAAKMNNFARFQYPM